MLIFLNETKHKFYVDSIEYLHLMLAKS